MPCGGCNRKKNVNRYGQVIIKRGKVTGKLLLNRQKECKGCVHADHKDPVKLTIRSTCKITNRMLINALKDPKYECPIKKFGQVKPK